MQMVTRTSLPVTLQFEQLLPIACGGMRLQVISVVCRIESELCSVDGIGMLISSVTYGVYLNYWVYQNTLTRTNHISNFALNCSNCEAYMYDFSF